MASAIAAVRGSGALRSGAALVGALLALAGCAASAQAASPLVWSSPWLADNSSPFGNPNKLLSVSCPSVSLCVAVDQAGQVVTSTDPAGGSSSWSAALIDRLGVVEGFGSEVASVSCPSVSLCVAVNGNDDVLTSTDPAGGPKAWRVVHLDESGPREFNGISCPSVSLCVVVGGEKVIDSSNPTGGASAWTTVHLPRAPGLKDVSCPSQSLCVAVGDGVLISTDPTGGASTWMPGLEGGTCPSQNPSQSLCSHGELRGVACPSQSLCVAVSGSSAGPGYESGGVFTSTDPTGGPSTWRLSAVDHERNVDSVSCASVSLCVAVDRGGNVLTSTDPTTGASSWTPAHVDAPLKAYCQCNTLAVSCPSASLCVAVDEGGNVITSTDPAEGAASDWEPPLTIDAADELEAMSCPSVTRCYALDSASRIVTSGSPAMPGQLWSAFPVTNLANEPFNWYDYRSDAVISCPARVSLCVASDLTIGFDGGLVATFAASSHPSNGTQAWKPTMRSLDFLTDGISCPSRRLCVVAASNDIVTSTSPTVAGSWILHGVEPARNLITAVACPAVELCVAVDSRGNVLTSTHPAGPPRLWRIKHVDPTKDGTGRQSALYAVSCPTTRLCIAFDNDGNLLFSTHPTSGARTWKLVHLPGAAEAQDMTCPWTSLCVGLDEGNVATVTNPSSRNAAWTVRPVDPDSYLLSLSCPSASLCIAGDTHGNVLVGRPPS